MTCFQYLEFDYRDASLKILYLCCPRNHCFNNPINGEIISYKTYQPVKWMHVLSGNDYRVATLFQS